MTLNYNCDLYSIGSIKWVGNLGKARLLDGAEKEDKGWFPRESREPRTRQPLAGTSIGSVVSRRVMQIRVSAGVNLMVRPQVRATRTARTTHLRANGSSKVEEQEKRHISSFDRYFASDGCSIFSTQDFRVISFARYLTSYVRIEEMSGEHQEF